MTCDVIATGGKGNAVLLNNHYLFDCGVPYSKLRPYLKQIRMVFLTHIHLDHFNPLTIHKLCRTYPLIRFVCSKNLLTELVMRASVPLDRIILAAPEHSPKTIPGAMPGQWITIHTFPLIHDVENVAYVVNITGGDQDGTALYATDTHHIPFCAPDLDLYMIEANYTREQMEARKATKAEAGVFSYEARVEASHMSLETAMDWLQDNADHYKSKIVFLHGHVEKGENEDDPMDTSIFESDPSPQNNEFGGRTRPELQGYESECGCSGNAGEPLALGFPECDQW